LRRVRIPDMCRAYDHCTFMSSDYVVAVKQQYHAE
jgi:hypothetical protein